MAIESYQQYPEHTIAIYVGNEDLVPFGTYTVDDLIGHMDGKTRSDLGCGDAFWLDVLGPSRDLTTLMGIIRTTTQTSARPA